MKLSERVKKALKDNPSCRDNDTTLCALIWDEDCEKIGKDFKTISAIEFMHLMDTGKVSKQQSILRARRNVNNKQSETRGKSYKPQTVKAKEKATPVVSHLLPQDIHNDVRHGILCGHREMVDIHESLHWFRTHSPKMFTLRGVN